jgi:hypothetical protein
MHRVPVAIGIVAITLGAGLGGLWFQDGVQAGKVWHGIAEAARHEDGEKTVFDASMTATLPEPARRYFAFTLSEGMAIPSGVTLEMKGTLLLGDDPDAVPMAMEADQILALPHGFAWLVKARSGWMPLNGSDVLRDGFSWSRFWAYGPIPVARSGSSEDHWRASFGRMVAEAAFWSPASLLPCDTVVWTALGKDTARVTVTHRDIAQSVDIFLREDGAPIRVETMRWSDANESGTFRLQPFGGTMGDFRTIDGITVPMRVEGGNFIGTPDYTPFYKAEVTALEWLGGSDDGD